MTFAPHNTYQQTYLPPGAFRRTWICPYVLSQTAPLPVAKLSIKLIDSDTPQLLVNVLLSVFSSLVLFSQLKMDIMRYPRSLPSPGVFVLLPSFPSPLCYSFPLPYREALKGLYRWKKWGVGILRGIWVKWLEVKCDLNVMQ